MKITGGRTGLNFIYCLDLLTEGAEVGQQLVRFATCETDRLFHHGRSLLLFIGIVRECAYINPDR